MIDHEITSTCPRCYKKNRLVWYDEEGRHEAPNVCMFVMRFPEPRNVYRVDCPCGEEYTFVLC